MRMHVELELTPSKHILSLQAFSCHCARSHGPIQHFSYKAKRLLHHLTMSQRLCPCACDSILSGLSVQLQALRVCATANVGEEAEAAESGSDTEAMSWARRPVTGSRASTRRRRRVRTSTGDATCSSQFRGVSKHRSAAAVAASCLVQDDTFCILWFECSKTHGCHPLCVGVRCFRIACDKFKGCIR